MIWYLKQLFPFIKYKTIYKEGEKTIKTTWNMFLGKCFNQKCWEKNKEGIFIPV